MAKISASAQIRPWLDLLRKHHFWLLASLVPLVLLPLLFLARETLTSQIGEVRRQIDGHIAALKVVREIPQHPNDFWSNDIDTSTMRVKRETLAEWKKFWVSQQPLRVWPEVLGDDFVKKYATTLKPDTKLPPQYRERYQNMVRTLVRELPARMGVEDRMGDASEPQQGRSPPPPRPELMRPGMMPDGVTPEVSPYLSSWSGENQQRIYASFNWDKAPTPAKVLLAQEELWVYGLLCDAVAALNKSATGPHNAAIASVDELSVGYPAAEDNPGGVSGGRVTRVSASLTPGAMEPPPEMAPPGIEGAAVGRPPNPRFGGGQNSGPMGAPPGEAAVAVEPDEQLRNWIYVNFQGKPLNAAELAAAVDSQMVHLMPFVLRVVIDQRQIDPLLVALATTSIPIDVRQVRINAGGGASGGPSMGPTFAEPVAGGPANASRLYDVNLELRGTVGLATQPTEAAVGLEPGQGDVPASDGAGEKSAPPPKAAMSSPVALRRTA